MRLRNVFWHKIAILQTIVSQFHEIAATMYFSTNKYNSNKNQ